LLVAESRRIPISTADLSGREEEYVLDCIRSTWISSKGEYISRFEERFAEFCDARHAVACNNGTTALHLALVALGIGPGDEVLVPTLTFVASANAVHYCGATPVFVDSLTGSWNMDPDDAARKIGPKTRAIMPVHLFGSPAPMEPILALARQHGLKVVEDAAEAHGATYDGTSVGALGDAGTYSFYGNKIVTTGEGGAVVTNDAALAEQLALLRGQGQSPDRRYWFPVIGFNYRMTNIQAAIGLAQLEDVEGKLERRRVVADAYKRGLADLGVTLQETEARSTSAHWMVSVLLPVETDVERDAIATALDADGIETRPIFYPLHSLPPYVASPGAAGEFPVATRVAATGISLPTHAALDGDDISFVCERLAAALSARPIAVT
jgi:perosamine synthetase